MNSSLPFYFLLFSSYELKSSISFSIFPLSLNRNIGVLKVKKNELCLSLFSSRTTGKTVKCWFLMITKSNFSR